MMHDEPLPPPSTIKDEFRLSLKNKEFIQESRNTIKNILSGKDNRFLLIVGPCSIHDPLAGAEYAAKLKELANEVSSTCYIVMRSYFEKPRTTSGWKGLLYDPNLDGSHNIYKGICLCRQFLLNLADLEMPAATEFLDPITPWYFGDLVTWGCIGARTVGSQIHRQFASGLSMPMGFKNGTNGDIEIAVNGASSASMPHTFIGLGEKGQASIVHTKGNPYTHVVLRGGNNGPNYDPTSICQVLDLLEKAELPLRILVDCSHDNAEKQHQKQIKVFQSAIEQVAGGNLTIKGLLLESYLHAGNQKIKTPLKYGVSLTDPCLDWDTTSQLISWGHSQLKKMSSIQVSYESQYVHQN